MADSQRIRFLDDYFLRRIHLVASSLSTSDEFKGKAEGIFARTVIALASAGIRKDEICRLKCGDVDFKNPGSLMVWSSKEGAYSLPLAGNLSGQLIELFAWRKAVDLSVDRESPLLTDRFGHRLTPHNLLRHIKHLGYLAEVEGGLSFQNLRNIYLEESPPFRPRWMK
jgi:integrase